MSTIAFKTFGCRTNSLDTDAMEAEAKRRGYQVVDESQPADTYVINSCTVTQAADKEARILAQRYKRKNPDAKIAMVGCYAQVAEEEVKGIAAVDVILGTADKLKLFDLIEDSTATKQQSLASATGFLPEFFPGSRNARANIKVQDGCNFSCSYCIIPKARGRSRSLPLETVIKQVQEAYAQGFQEVVLTGIHLAHYGWDKNTNLLKLIEAILALEPGPRLRLSTLDPFEIPEELVQLVGTHPKLCPYFHIALQSGSDAILKSMRRIYKAQEFVHITQKLHAQCPSVFIGVDVIVGFPEESEEAFQETVQCLEESPWSKLHVFPFSVRKGTKAETLPNPVPAEVMKARAKQLRDMSDIRYQAFLHSQIDSQQEVLLEKPMKKDAGLWQGHTANYTPVLVPGSPGFESRQVHLLKLGQIQGQSLLAVV